jgi:2Fe-2S ferredoxin
MKMEPEKPMPRITFIAHDGTRRQVEARSGESLMLAAVNNSVAGIDADCGGQCACATCHVVIEPSWAALLPAIASHEEEMLNFTTERREGSRLACQIPVTDLLDGLSVQLPEGQH